MTRWTGDGAGEQAGIPPIQYAPTIPMEQVEPYIWLYSIDLPTSPRTKLRLTPYPETLQYEADSAGAAISWYPYSIGHNGVTRDTEGKLSSATLLVQNVTLTMAAFLRTHNGLIGERVRIVLVHKPDLPVGAPIRDEEYEIQSAQVTDGQVSFSLGQYSLYRVAFPNRRITRGYCDHRYGGAGCGYDTTRSGALRSCDKTELGANGCAVHGLDEAAAGLTNRHPNRMLVFQGVLRPSGLGLGVS